MDPPRMTTVWPAIVVYGAGVGVVFVDGRLTAWIPEVSE